MDQKSGLMTTEFWISALTALAIAAFGVLMTYGLVTQEQTSAWMGFVAAALAVVVPLALAAVARKYTEARTEVKLESIKRETESIKLETVRAERNA